MAYVLIKLDKGIPKTHESLVIDEDNEVRIYGTDIFIGEAIELSDNCRIIDLDKVRSKIDPIINWSVISKLLEDAFVETST